MAVSAKILGKRLRKARMDKGYTQEYVAEKVQFTPEHVSRIERGLKPIYLHKLGEWCDLLDIPLSEVIDGAAIPENAQYNRQFGEIARGCSQDTVDAMLETCRAFAQVERMAKEEKETKKP